MSNSKLKMILILVAFALMPLIACSDDEDTGTAYQQHGTPIPLEDR